MRTVGIVPARMDSKRLPGKALREVAHRPLLGYVLARARRVHGLQAVVLATTRRGVDRPLVNFARSQDVDVFEGDCDDVAGRFLGAADIFSADYFVRLNADSPFLDPRLVEDGIVAARRSGADLVTNLPGRTFPYGIAVEVLRTAAFRQAYPRMTGEDREHVTRQLYESPGDLQLVTLRSAFPELAAARLVVDTEDDLNVFRTLVERLGDRAVEVDYVAVARLELELRSQSVLQPERN